MNWAQYLLAFVLALPAPWRDQETESELIARRTLIVEVAVEVTREPLGQWSHRDRAALLLAKVIHESGYLRRAVHAGEQRGDRGSSICLGQIHWGSWLPYSRDEWEALAGVDRGATKRCLAETWRQLVLYHRCGTRPSALAASRIMAGYGTGNSCKVTLWSRRRSKTWVRLAGR